MNGKPSYIEYSAIIFILQEEKSCLIRTMEEEEVALLQLFKEVVGSRPLSAHLLLIHARVFDFVCSQRSEGGGGIFLGIS